MKYLEEFLNEAVSRDDLAKSIYGLAKSNAGRWKSDKQKKFLMKMITDGDKKWQGKWYPLSSMLTYGNQTDTYVKFDDGGVNQIKSVASKSGKENITFTYTPETEESLKGHGKAMKLQKEWSKAYAEVKTLIETNSDKSDTTIESELGISTFDKLMELSMSAKTPEEITNVKQYKEFTEDITDMIRIVSLRTIKKELSPLYSTVDTAWESTKRGDFHKMEKVYKDALSKLDKIHADYLKKLSSKQESIKKEFNSY